MTEFLYIFSLELREKVFHTHVYDIQRDSIEHTIFKNILLYFILQITVREIDEQKYT